MLAFLAWIRKEYRYLARFLPTSAPTRNPPTGYASLYADAQGALKVRLPDGTVVTPGGGDGVATALRTTTGPTTLTVGAVADGQYLRRSGSAIVGVYMVAVVSFADGLIEIADDGTEISGPRLNDGGVSYNPSDVGAEVAGPYVTPGTVA